MIVADIKIRNTYAVQRIYYSNFSFFYVAVLTSRFTKICVSVDSEAELLEIYNQARLIGLVCSLIEDAGLTEFGRKKTLTAVAVGPDQEDKIDTITRHLKLF